VAYSRSALRSAVTPRRRGGGTRIIRALPDDPITAIVNFLLSLLGVG
jgi:hypothetical protein